jgi:hypothetical protein
MVRQLAGDHRGRVRDRRIVRCGWCKGFVVERWEGGQSRYRHEVPPATDHEVLPYVESYQVPA